MKERKRRSFVTVMVIIAVSAVSLRLISIGIVKFTITQNESRASASLKLISAALEKYSQNNKGVYPENIIALTQGSPSYLDSDYTSFSPVWGYDFGCPRLEASGYSCYATPASCNLTGDMVFTVTTGGLLVSEDCKEEEEE